MSKANMQTLSNIKHPLAHCELAKAYHNAWAIALRDHTVGSRKAGEARKEFLLHIGVIEDEEKNCEICIEHNERRGNANRKRELFMVRGIGPAEGGRVPAGD